jgi:putative serine/threonine protein kinase
LSQQNKTSLDDGLEIDSPRLVPIISYPHFSPGAYAERIDEIRELGVTSLALGGSTIVNGLNIAGKGSVGLVIRARIGSRVCVLKVRRTDAGRESMHQEAHLHKIANTVGVGPRLVGHTRNVIAMEFINGETIVEWVTGASKEKVCDLARSVLGQCYNLDKAGLDHGELSRLGGHVMVTDAAYIIDFESASMMRRTSNVTAATQSIFLYGPVANQVKKILGDTNREKAISALKAYKQEHSTVSFQAVLDSLPI